MFTEKTRADRLKIKEMQIKMWDIFDDKGGYEYNDAMLYQLQGIQMSLDECEDDDDIPHMLKEATETMKFFDWVVEYKDLMEREPPQLYA